MKLTRKIYHLALADFRERTRRYSFLIVLGLVGLLVTPSTPAMPV